VTDRRDLTRLARWAARQTKELTEGRRVLQPGEGAPVEVEAEPDEVAYSLAEALDHLTEIEGLGPVALARLERAGEEIDALRGRTGQPLADLVQAVMRESGIVEALETAGPGASVNLTGFLGVVAGFAPVAGDPSLPAFLAYLDAAVRVLPIAIAAGEAPVAPTYENVALAKYPLSRLVFFNVNKAPGKPLPPALDEFLRFVLSREGQEVVRDHGIYLPLRASQVQGGRVMLAAAPPAGAAPGAMSKIAQSLLEKTLVEHPEAAHLVMHVTPPGRPDTDNEIIASNIGKIGKKADDDDLRILRTGHPETVVSKTGDRFNVSLPLFDSGRNTIGVVAIGLRYKPGDDKAALVRTAERIRDELRAQIPSAARFF